MNDLAQDVVKGALDAAKDGSVKVFVVLSIVVVQRWNPRPTHASPPTPALGRHVKDGHVKDAGESAILIKQNCSLSKIAQ